MNRFATAVTTLYLHISVVSAQSIDQVPQPTPAPSREEPGVPPDDPPPTDPGPSPTPAPSLPLREIAPEEVNPNPYSTIKHTPTTIAICVDDEGSQCRVFDMPAEIGKVDRYVHGLFMSFEVAQSSWLAITQQGAHVCYLAKMDDTVTCAQVKALIPEFTDIRYRNPGSDLAYLSFQRLQPTSDMQDYYLKTRVFSQAVIDASVALEKQAYDVLMPLAGKAPPKSMKIENTVPMPSDGSWWESQEGSTFTSDTMPVVTITGTLDREQAIASHPDGDRFHGFLHVSSDGMGYQRPRPLFRFGWVPENATTRCVNYILYVICTAKRARPWGEESLTPTPVQPKPFVFPTICNMTGFLCSKSDEVKRAEDLELRRKICEINLEAGIDACERRHRNSDYRSRQACKDDRTREYGDCMAQAQRANSDLYD